jgi:hypothetical protein
VTATSGEGLWSAKRWFTFKSGEARGISGTGVLLVKAEMLKIPGVLSFEDARAREEEGGGGGNAC